MTAKNLTTSQAWTALNRHAKEMMSTSISDLFKNNPLRSEQLLVATSIGIFDFAKNNISEETIKLLDQLFSETELNQAIEAQFTGQKINTSEHRAVLHTALRDISNTPVYVDGENVKPNILAELQKMKAFSNEVRSGQKLGYTGKRITDIVNIGIGGSDLGPKMAYNALINFTPKDLKVHFVSNVDGADLHQQLENLNPETTLFIIASKTFTTQETMANAEYAKQWFLKRGEENDVAKHFVAVSTNTERVTEFGIDPMNMFVFWNWVGGRFSVWSTIGLSLCIAIGYEKFEQFLNGANWMDNHFRKEPTHKNIPKLMAGIGMFYSNFFNAKTQAILPYSQNMNLFPAFLQQADMESNGKTVDLDGKQVNYSTGPVVWGKAGTNGQHAFYQLIHQGTQIVPTDFIGFCKSLSPLKGHHDKLMANFFAQPEALMNGKDESQVRAELESQGLSTQELNQLLPYKVFEGNKPSNSFLLNELNPYTLGALIAAYEHKIFVQGIIWNINSFDQWGVELGKQLAGKILPELNSKESISSHDQSTNALINYYNNY